MKIAVLGSAGFLGQVICNNLGNNYEIIPVTRQTLDLLNYQKVDTWLQKENPDVIINCATSGGKQRLTDQDYDDLQNNISLFLNFYNNPQVKKFINIGSGAEFDKNLDITNIDENEIFNRMPKDSYGYSKNVIAKLCQTNNRFYTLRIFGIFDKTEPDFRLLKKAQKQEVVLVVNKQFDWISSSDFLKVLNYYIQTDQPKYNNINVVYQDKIDLMTFLETYKKLHNKTFKLESNIDIKNYTGSADKLADLDIKLDGWIQGLQEYE
jgi:GDP-L-fucose synthase